MDRHLRAKVLLAEAESLGLTIGDLAQAAAVGTAASGVRSVPTVAEYVEVISPTFSKGTLRTYRSYWRLAVELIGDRLLDVVTTDDCAAVWPEAGALALMVEGTQHTYRTWTRRLVADYGDPAEVTAGDLTGLIARHVLARRRSDERRCSGRSAEENPETTGLNRALAPGP